MKRSQAHEIPSRSMYYPLTALLLSFTMLCSLFVDSVARAETVPNTTVSLNTFFPNQSALTPGDQKIASFTVSSDNREEMLYYFTLRLTNNAYWNFSSFYSGGMYVRVNGQNFPTTISASGSDVRIDFSTPYTMPAYGYTVFDVYAQVTSKNTTFSSTLLQNGMYMRVNGSDGVPILYYPLKQDLPLQSIGVGTAAIDALPRATNSGQAFDKYFMTISDIRPDYTTKSLQWTHVGAQEVSAYKILFYTGEANFYDRIVDDNNWVPYDGTGTANKVAFDNKRIVDFGIGNWDTENFSLALLVKSSSGMISRSGTISTRNPSANYLAPVGNLTYSGTSKLTWTIPSKDIADYRINFFTNEALSQTEFQRRMDAGAPRGEIRFGPSWTDNLVRSYSFSYTQGGAAFVELKNPLLQGTTYSMSYIGRSGQRGPVGNITLTEKFVEPSSIPRSINGGKRFEQYPISTTNMTVDGFSRVLRWTHEANSGQDIAAYKILFYTGEGNFYSTGIDDTGWVPADGKGIANKVITRDNRIVDFNVGDWSTNHSLALMFKNKQGYITRSGILSTNNSSGNPILSIMDFNASTATKLTWTTPTKDISDYKIQFFTNEILSQEEFSRRIQAGQSHGEYRFGPAYTDTSAIRAYTMTYAANGKSSVEVSKGILQPSTSYALSYTSRSSISSPSSNTTTLPLTTTPTITPTVTPTYPTVTPQKFYDVPANAWYAPYVQELSEKNIMTGDQGRSTFRPTDAVIRAEAAKIFLKAKGINPTSTTMVLFCDVRTSDWFAPYVNTLYMNSWSEGFIGGNCSFNREFRPGQALTRAEAVKMLLAINDVTVEGVTAQQLQMFSDVHTSDWFAPYVVKAYELGLIKGYDDGRFGPYDTINRAEIAKITKLSMQSL